MKKVKVLLLISLILPFLSGCIIKEKDITQIVFPVTIMISKEEDKYRLHMLRLSNSMSSKIELESGLQDTMYSTLTFEGNTISEASEKIGVVTNGNISAIKVRSLILHESLFTNSSINYRQITAYIINNPLYRTNIYVYYTKDDPDKILNINSLNFSTNTHFYLTRPDKKHLNDIILPSKLLDTAKSYVDNKRMFYLPSLKMSTDHVKQENEGELKEVNYYVIDGGYFLTKDGEFKFIDIEHLKGFRWKGKNDYFDIELGDEQNLLNVKVEDCSWKTSIKDGNIYVDIKATSKINYNHTDHNSLEVEELLKNRIKDEIIETYQYAYNDIDIYWFNDLSYRLNKKIDSDDTFNLNINSIIKNTIYEY